MAEVGIDISGHVPHSVQEYRALDWDYVITVCGGAKEHCPVFTAAVKHRVHLGFEDPAQIKADRKRSQRGFGGCAIGYGRYFRIFIGRLTHQV